MKRFAPTISLVVALALATVSAAPAQAASDRDVARVVVGALALFAIGTAISNSKAQANRQPDWQNSTRYDYDQRRHDLERRREIERRPQHDNRIVLPAVCTNGRNGNAVAQWVSPNCLRANLGTRVRLPQNCARNFNTRRGPQPYYETACLQRNGFRLEARRH